MSEQIVGLFSTHQGAEAAKQTLERAGLSSAEVLIDSQSVGDQLPIQDTKALKSAMYGGLLGGILGSILGLMIGIIVNDIAEPGLNATPHVSPILLMVGGGLIGAIAIGIIASLTGVNVADPKKDVAKRQEVHAVIVTGSHDQFMEATRIMQNVGD